MSDNSRGKRIQMRDKGGHSGFSFEPGDDVLEYVDRYTEQSHFSSRAAAVRSLLMIGIRATILHDPRQGDTRSNHHQSEADDSRVVLDELVPEGEENAVEVPNEFLEVVKKEIPEMVDNNPQIKRKDGYHIYK